MSTITKERLQWLANISGRHDIDDIDGEEIRELARIALASLEAEPIYQLWDEGYYDTQKETYDTVLNAVDTGVRGRIVYTAPPALVSVPDESAIELLATDLMERIDKITGERHSLATVSSLRVSIVEACRAAMLQGAENAESTTTMQTAPARDSSPKIADSTSGNSPVIPDGWVLVPIEPTYQMCEAMGLQWESPRFPDRYKGMLAAVKK